MQKLQKAIHAVLAHSLLSFFQGYRTVSDKVWTVGQTSRDGDLIATLIDPDPNDEGEEDSEVVPLMAVYELMMSAGFDEQLGESPEQWM